MVRLPLILIGPLLHDLVWSMRRTRSPAHKERFVRFQGLMFSQPGDGVVSDVSRQVITLGRSFWWMNNRRIADYRTRIRPEESDGFLQQQ